MKNILLIILRPSDFIEMNRLRESLSSDFRFKSLYFSPGKTGKVFEDPKLEDIEEDVKNVLKQKKTRKKKKNKKKFN